MLKSERGRSAETSTGPRAEMGRRRRRRRERALAVHTMSCVPRARSTVLWMEFPGTLEGIPRCFGWNLAPRTGETGVDGALSG